jgi:hypothetical protein
VRSSVWQLHVQLAGMLSALLILHSLSITQSQSSIGSGIYTAAASQSIYDSGGLSWCGSGCGKCYQLTSTGNAPCSTCGSGGAAGQSIIVMVTNLCPNSGNAQWCANPGGSNQYGYQYHFDIMASSPVLVIIQLWIFRRWDAQVRRVVILRSVSVHRENAKKVEKGAVYI